MVQCKIESMIIIVYSIFSHANLFLFYLSHKLNCHENKSYIDYHSENTCMYTNAI